jgi:hypothetical protein
LQFNNLADILPQQGRNHLGGTPERSYHAQLSPNEYGVKSQFSPCDQKTWHRLARMKTLIVGHVLERNGRHLDAF